MQAVQSATEVMDLEQEVTHERAWYSGILKNFLVRRLFRAFLTIFIVATIIFFLVRLLPGNPIDVYVNQQVTMYGYTQEEAENQARSLFSIDLSEPLWKQYLTYLNQLAHGNLGTSITIPGASVAGIIQSRIWWTVFSTGIGLLLSFLFGSLIGMIMAYRRGGKLDGSLTSGSSLLGSVPQYQLALIIIVILGVKLGWIPYTKMRGSVSSGQPVELSFAFIADAFYHALLPIATYVVTTISGWMLLMKSTTVSALDEDFVTAARARGIPEWRILVFYVGRIAVLPLFTSLTISIGFIVGGSLLVEPIFQYQGMGARLYDAINQRDYTVLQGMLLITTITVVVALLISDLILSRIDPRIKSGR